MVPAEEETEASVRAEIEVARTDLLQIDRDISVINEALERLMMKNDSQSSSNCLKLSVSKVERAFYKNDSFICLLNSESDLNNLNLTLHV